MNTFENITALTNALSEKIAEQLTQAIHKKGQALLAVSGGSTPKPLFEKLSKMAVDWKNVWVVLVDERWVDTESIDSNEHLVCTSLLTNLAKSACFVPLKSNDVSAKEAQEGCNASLQSLPANIDVLLLGMGDDGHTASIFPCADKHSLTKILNTHNPLRVMAMQPTSAPYERMSLTAAYLLKSHNMYLLLKGGNKLNTYNKALAAGDVMAMPIRAFMNQSGNALKVYYAEK